MSRSDDERLADVLASAAAIRAHLERGSLRRRADRRADQTSTAWVNRGASRGPTNLAATTGDLSAQVLSDGLVFDAVRVRLIEIGEAVRAVDPELLGAEPDIPWSDIAAMRNHLAHRYFDTAVSIVQSTVEVDLPPLVAAVERLLRSDRPG